MILEKEKIWTIYLEMAILYNKILNSSLGQNGLLYLKSRGFDVDFINKYMIGYVPENHNNLFIYNELLLNQKKYNIVDLLDSHAVTLLKEHAQIVDFFSQKRIIFPIFVSNNIVGFSSRTIIDDVSPKYKILTSDKIIPYNVNTINTSQVLYITEGVIDCLSLCKMGYNTIGLFGTGGLSKENVSYLKDHKNKIIILFDSEDNPATARALKRTASILRWAGHKDIYAKYLPRFGMPKMDVNQLMLSFGLHSSNLLISSLKEEPIDIFEENKPTTYSRSSANKLDILDVISKFVTSFIEEGHGKYRCLCPFPDHNDTKPSFIILRDENKNYFKCYGCSRYGGPIRFLMDYFNVNNVDDALAKYKNFGGN